MDSQLPEACLGSLTPEHGAGFVLLTNRPNGGCGRKVGFTPGLVMFCSVEARLCGLTPFEPCVRLGEGKQRGHTSHNSDSGMARWRSR